MDVSEILKLACDRKASDIFIIPGLPVSVRIQGTIMKLIEEKPAIEVEPATDDKEAVIEPAVILTHIGETPVPSEVIERYSKKVMPESSDALIDQIYDLAKREQTKLDAGDDDFALSVSNLSRFRVNAFMQRGSKAAVIRIISFNLPNAKDLGIPQNVIELAKNSKGLVLVTGPTDCGKSTTLACMINAVNESQHKHIITLEDPIEHLHRHDQSIVTQREINIDTGGYANALRASLRQSPDIILLGEMRDYETISVAMTAAETGHLVLSTLHTVGAANTIDRIIDVFPADQQAQIAVQLSMVLTAVVSQQLVPTKDEKRALALEVMTVTPAIRNMIRENKVHQIDGVIYSSAKEDMMSMDSSLFKLYDDGIISADVAVSYATNPDMLRRKVQR